MKSSFTFAIVCGMFLAAGTAGAVPASSANSLGECISACEEQLKLICFDESHRDITELCPNIPACSKDTLSDSDRASASALLGACYEGVTNHCPSNCPPGGPAEAKEPPKPGPPKTTRRQPPTVRPPTKKGYCEQAGGFWLTEPGGTEQFCYTHQAMYEHLLAVEARLNELEKRAQGYVDQGQPVPGEIRDDADSQMAILKSIDLSVDGLNEQLNAMSDRIIEYGNHFNQRISALEGRMDQTEAKSDQALQEARAARLSTGIEPALTGWSVGPYFTLQAFDQFGEAQYAGGLELGVFPSLAANGRHRLALNFGVGKAANYMEKSMVQHHAAAGYAYFAPQGALMLMAGMNRYSLTDVQQGRLLWVGPLVEGRLNLTGTGDSPEASTSPQLYFMGRIGAGYRWGRHNILDTSVEPVRGRFDAPIFLGLGLQGVPILGD